MARHGALIELGWEIQDFCERLWERVTHSDGVQKQPWALLKFILIHHTMQWCMIIPMNLYYSSLPGYHQLIMSLELAAGIAVFVQFYGSCCDTSKRHELLQLLISSAICFVVMVYTRMIHYWWSVIQVLNFFYASGAYAELTVGFLVGFFAMPYIAVTCIPDLWSKLQKFWKQYREGGAPIAEQESGSAKEHEE